MNGLTARTWRDREGTRIMILMTNDAQVIYGMAILIFFIHDVSL